MNLPRDRAAARTAVAPGVEDRERPIDVRVFGRAPLLAHALCALLRSQPGVASALAVTALPRPGAPCSDGPVIVLVDVPLADLEVLLCSPHAPQAGAVVWIAALGAAIPPGAEPMVRPSKPARAVIGRAACITEALREAHRMGVRVVLTPDDSPDSLAAAVGAAARRREFRSPAIRAAVLRPPLSAAAVKDTRRGSAGTNGVIATRNGGEDAHENAHGDEGGTATYDTGLSPRQEEVARLAAAGLSNQEIGATLFIDVTTVKTHLTDVFRKFGIRRRSQIVARLYD